ncbi:MAG: hypothetical protein LBH73_07730 [Spirochaetaceae bacterium]|jgi:hypothetical protein|nr:hypothetical protein [Spirochaetaceae bacterium]
MNTIPTTFNGELPSYTAVGGTRRGGSSGLSVVLLNRGGRYPRRILFQEFEKAGFDYVISIEGKEERYDLEELSGRFPFVRFILLKDEINQGQRINLAVSELDSPLFFVLWNDIRILHGIGALKMAERLLADAAEEKARISPYKRLCTVPVIQNSGYHTLPAMISPALHQGLIKTLPYVPPREGNPTLYPLDCVGIYDRRRFIALGGFDSTIRSPYWQLMDFGVRAWLWGENIACTQLVRVCYDGELPPEDSSAGVSYKRFFLKNLAPVFRGDFAHLPLGRFPAYLFSSGEGPFAAWDEYSAARRWVERNKYRFTTDMENLVKNWEQPLP